MVNWKTKIQDSNPSKTTLYGGLSIDYILDYFSSVDHSDNGNDSFGIATIATHTRYESGAFQLLDTSADHRITFTLPEYTENHTITYPNESELGTSDEYLIKDAVQITTNKVVNATDNSITDDSIAAGDILASNGTKFIRKAMGTSLQVLRTNSGATNIEWASLENETVGKAVASGDNFSTVFNIAHGLGSPPSYTFIDCSSLSIPRTFAVDSTNIVVDFDSAPPSGTNNVVIYWRVIA